MRILLITVFAIIFPLLTFSQNECACCTPEHDQFDFWLGDWVVFNEKGEKIGENLVEELENNCLISENWKGSNGGSGKSFNYYDPETELWNQLWISSSGNILKLKGVAQADKMTLKSELIENGKGQYYHQITWTKNPDGSVTQLWEILDKNEEVINESFKGIYRKKQ